MRLVHVVGPDIPDISPEVNYAVLALTAAYAAVQGSASHTQSAGWEGPPQTSTSSTSLTIFAALPLA